MSDAYFLRILNYFVQQYILSPILKIRMMLNSCKFIHSNFCVFLYKNLAFKILSNYRIAGFTVFFYRVYLIFCDVLITSNKLFFLHFLYGVLFCFLCCIAFLWIFWFLSDWFDVFGDTFDLYFLSLNSFCFALVPYF